MELGFIFIAKVFIVSRYFLRCQSICQSFYVILIVAGHFETMLY